MPSGHGCIQMQVATTDGSFRQLKFEQTSFRKLIPTFKNQEKEGESISLNRNRTSSRTAAVLFIWIGV